MHGLVESHDIIRGRVGLEVMARSYDVAPALPENAGDFHFSTPVDLS